MRFTIKTKLAGAFGAVILLSAITAGVGFVGVSETVSTTEAITGAAGRSDKASMLKEYLLLQVRAEKNVLLEEKEADVDRFVGEANNQRTAFAKKRDEIYAVASETGKKML